MTEFSSYPQGVGSWVDLMPRDVQSARAFYGAVFGWEFDEGAPEMGRYTTCRVGGKSVAGMGGEPGQSEHVAWTTYFAVDDLDATLTAVAAGGGKVLMGPMDVGDAGRMGIATDARGAVFGLWQAGEMTGAQLANEPGAVCWNELNSRGVAAAKEFYAGLFGWEYEPVPGEMTYDVYSVPGHGAAGGIMQMGHEMPAEVPEHWAVYFSHADVDAAVAAVQASGGSLLFGPNDTPFGRMAAVMDPEGATFYVITPPAHEG